MSSTDIAELPLEVVIKIVTGSRELTLSVRCTCKRFMHIPGDWDVCYVSRDNIFPATVTSFVNVVRAGVVFFIIIDGITCWSAKRYAEDFQIVAYEYVLQLKPDYEVVLWSDFTCGPSPPRIIRYFDGIADDISIVWNNVVLTTTAEMFDRHHNDATLAKKLKWW